MLKYSKSKSLFHYSQMFMQLRKESTDIQTDANYSKQKNTQLCSDKSFVQNIQSFKKSP